MARKELLYKSPNHVTNLNNMRLNNKWCDVTIGVDGMKIRAHKVILAANLKYFDMMFSNDAFQESKQNVISMKSVKGADLEVFVTYAYTGEILLTDSNALNLLITANYLGENVIADVCIEFLKKHLKAEEACRAYKFANTIDCITLQNVAKRKILSNFGICSQTTDYLDFDYEHLRDILSDGKAQPAMSQQQYFEGIMKWMMHNIEARKIHMDDLLNFVDITKLNTDDLGGYLYRNMIEYNDEYATMRDRIMYYYHTTKDHQMKSQVVIAEQTLATVGIKNKKLTFQLYNFTKKKWFTLEECLDVHDSQNTVLRGVILNSKLYYINKISAQEDEIYLSMYNPATKESKRLHSSNRTLSRTASCTCDRLLYLCGGIDGNFSLLRQILVFNPETNSLGTLTPMKTTRVDAAAIFYQGCLHVLGGWTDSFELMNSVEKYDPIKKEWTDFPSMCNVHCRHGVAVLGDKIYACGGKETRYVEVYDPCKNRWQIVASMNKKREYFLLIAHDGKLWAIGGDTESTVEVYDPLTDDWQMDHELSSGLQIENPQGGLIPFSNIANAN